MKIDERIIDGARPFTLYDTDKAKEYLNKECYLSDYMHDFVDVERYCQVGRLVDINDNVELPFKTVGELYFEFCLPCEWVKQKSEITYKPYTLETFENEFNIGDVVMFRGKSNTDRAGSNYKCVYSGYRIFTETCSISNSIVILGLWGFPLSELFDLYEIYRDGNWEPFGRKVENIDICAGAENERI